jgi:hypothetical protein
MFVETAEMKNGSTRFFMAPGSSVKRLGIKYSHSENIAISIAEIRDFINRLKQTNPRLKY